MGLPGRGVPRPVESRPLRRPGIGGQPIRIRRNECGDEDLQSEADRNREEVVRRRRRRPRSRAACQHPGEHPAWQEQADLHPPHGLRRQHRRHQCGEGEADRQQARRRHLLLAHRLSGRDQGPFQGPDPGRQVSGACDREGRGAHGSARSARPSADDPPQGLQGRHASARCAAAGRPRRRRPEPEE
ncbi:hypothetical protein Lal_00013685 [Lupinus albus]|nr:hypothetical protein Lal_00013685 [Lupinus albus]